MTVPIAAIVAANAAATAAAINASNAARVANKKIPALPGKTTDSDGVPILHYIRKSRARRLWLFIRKPFTAPALYVKNTRYLDERGWYRTVSGGYRDSHGCGFYSLKDLCSIKIYK